MAQRNNRKRRMPNWQDAEYPPAKRIVNPGQYGNQPNKTSAYPLYKYVSPVAKKLQPGPSVKKTEYHAVVNYPQIYAGTTLYGGPAPDVADVGYGEIKGVVYPHVSLNMRAQCLTMCAQGNSATDRTGNAVDAKGIQLYVTIKPPALHRTNEAGDAAVLPPGQKFRPLGPAGQTGEFMGELNSTLAAVQGAQARIVVLLDKDFTGGKPPRVSDVFTDGCFSGGIAGSNYNNVFTTNSQMRPDATQRFLTVMNKVVPISSMGNIKTIKKNIKLDGLEIRYTNGEGDAGPTFCAQNTLWLFVLVDWQTPEANEALPATVTSYLPVYTFTSRFRFLPK